MIYHIGTVKRGKTLVIQARRDIDFLDCEIYDYLGKRETTKTFLKKHRMETLAYLKEKRPEVYGDLHYAIVE